MSAPATRSPAPASRRHASYRAFLAHRISGVLLALFLPLHFLALGLALESEAQFQNFIVFTDHPLMKTAEWGLITLLGLHLVLGLRLVLLELGAWQGMRLQWVRWAACFAAMAGLTFLAVLVN